MRCGVALDSSMCSRYGSELARYVVYDVRCALKALDPSANRANAIERGLVHVQFVGTDQVASERRSLEEVVNERYVAGRDWHSIRGECADDDCAQRRHQHTFGVCCMSHRIERLTC
jgi:hypothetical protein